MSQAGTRSGKTYIQKSTAIQANFSDSGKSKSKKKMNPGRQDDGTASEGVLESAAPEGVPSGAPTGVSPTDPQTGVPQRAAREVVLDSADPPGSVHDTTYQGKGVPTQAEEDTSKLQGDGDGGNGKPPTTTTHAKKSIYDKGSSSKDLGTLGKTTGSLRLQDWPPTILAK